MKKIWTIFIVSTGLSFATLIWIGTRIYQEKPPIPAQYVTTDGEIFLTKQDIQQGQAVWRMLGGMELGSIWGHGGYLAPDWTAEYLHREALFVLNDWAKSEQNMAFDQLDAER